MQKFNLMRQQTTAKPDNSLLPQSIKDLFSKTQGGGSYADFTVTGVTPSANEDFGSAIYNLNRFTFNPANLPAGV
jgi:hypothetical protein